MKTRSRLGVAALAIASLACSAQLASAMTTTTQPVRATVLHGHHHGAPLAKLSSNPKLR